MLYYNDKQLLLNSPIQEKNIQLDYINGIKPYIIKKENDNNELCAILDHQWANFGLDDYNGINPGPIKWYNLQVENNYKSPTKNQWFIIKKLGTSSLHV